MKNTRLCKYAKNVRFSNKNYPPNASKTDQKEGLKTAEIILKMAPKTIKNHLGKLKTHPCWPVMGTITGGGNGLQGAGMADISVNG